MIHAAIPPVVAETNYPASDGLPVGETPRHVTNLFYVSHPLHLWFADEPLTFVAANMFVYFEPGNNRRHVSPDIFVSLGIPKETDPPRQRYLLWEEPKGPDVVIEFTSESTVEEDRGVKRDLYRDVLQVREYFLFDSSSEILDPPLQGQRLVNGVYQPIQPVEGRLPSEVLRLHLEADGELLRLWNPATERWLPIPPEVQRSLLEESAARLLAEAARASEEKARQQAEADRAAEQQARHRAEAISAAEQEARKQAEAEVERLRRELEELRQRTSE